jgi:phage gpG-like protein
MGLTVDSKAWQAAVDKWEVLARAEGAKASRDGAEAVKTATAGLASIYTHKRGTKTPSPPGDPVGRISGALVGSLLVTDEGDMTSAVGPTTRYGRVQELGGATGGWWPGTLPDRPYLRPGTKLVIVSGILSRIYVEHWAAAQAAAAGG